MLPVTHPWYSRYLDSTHPPLWHKIFSQLPGAWNSSVLHCLTSESRNFRGTTSAHHVFFFRPRVLQVFEGHAGLSFDLPRSVIPNGHLDNALSVLGSCWRFLGSHQEGGYDHALDWSMTIDWFGGQSREAKQLHSSICLKLVHFNFNVKKNYNLWILVHT